jgi:hypothetical protein
MNNPTIIPFHIVATHTDTGLERRSIVEHPKARPMRAGINKKKVIMRPSTSASASEPKLSAAAPLKKNTLASVDQPARI